MLTKTTSPTDDIASCRQLIVKEHSERLEYNNRIHPVGSHAQIYN